MVKVDSPEITVCLTSCGRFDLLKRTLNSFFALNTYPISRFIITEDSTNASVKDKILQLYGDKIELIFNEQNLGLYKSIDNMYNLVNTKYIFHCEDDWEFSGNKHFMKQSLDILEERKDIHQIWIRKDIDKEWIEPQIQTTSTGAMYNVVKTPHCGGWYGFTLNASLKRLDDYKMMFPNGYSSFIKPNERMVFTEYNCNLHTIQYNYKAALLKDGCATHIGHGRTTLD